MLCGSRLPVTNRLQVCLKHTQVAFGVGLAGTPGLASYSGLCFELTRPFFRVGIQGFMSSMTLCVRD